MNLFSKFKLYLIPYTLYAILLLAAFFRLYGLNWDQNYHLHPDERFLTMVTGGVKWPNSLGQYLDPKTSPLNPYNANYGFFVYGTLPMKIVKAVAELIKFDRFDYNNITLVGRVVSAFFDLGTVFLVFKIAQKIFNEKIGLLASFLYATCVLPIQLSHFYAVDTFLVFFLVLSFYFLTLFISHQSLVISALLGAAFGLAMACKISAVLFLFIIGLGFLYQLLKKRELATFVLTGLFFGLTAYVSFRLADPRVFADSNFLNPTPNPRFVSNLKELQSSGNPDTYFPPAVQWINTKPLIFPLKNMVLWGIGLPLGILVILGVFYSCFKLKNFNHVLILAWVILLFLYQGTQFAKTIRYFYPLYPFIILLVAFFYYQIFIFLKKKFARKFVFLFLGFSVFLFLLWPFSFLAIYSRLHSRVLASKWIYENIPPGSTISCEHWDDCLPLGINGKSHVLYQIETLTLYDPDTQEKWQKTNLQLEKIDYLIMSSNRLWGSIGRLPKRYPTTSQFYNDLFAEKLDFQKIAEITSYPTISLFNIQISDDSADESFTVYDHPKVIIFRKIL